MAKAQRAGLLDVFGCVAGPPATPPAFRGLGEDFLLPRKSPHLGFMRHAPSQELNELEKESDLFRLDGGSSSSILDDIPSLQEGCRRDLTSATQREVRGRLAMWRCMSCRGRDVSDISSALAVSATLASLDLEVELPPAQIPDDEIDDPMDAENLWHSFPEVPEEIWTMVLSHVVDLRSWATLSHISRGFASLVKAETTWCGRVVRIEPGMIHGIAPRLCSLLPVWRRAKKLVLPRDPAVMHEIAWRAPTLPLEVAWRFDSELKGAGVQVIQSGNAVRRTGDDDLVVFGDAPLPTTDGQDPYFEVCLDERTELEEINDFGIGVTACDPCDLAVIGSVADEVPRSWVVDFTVASVILNVNNVNSARGTRARAELLQQGDRVGVRVTKDGALEVFVNGILLEHLAPATSSERVPPGIPLYPVVDLYGSPLQMSRTDDRPRSMC
uniref:NHR domain-containing protein n=1 Tax=Noctiluca scintillans TaxID=2966 RepID=A0A7S1FE60_NOCSC